jgi:FlaA1/EpsC-like NDP-sugar epimerase
MCLQALAQEEMVSFALEGKSSNSFFNNTHFDIVRFGNVLGSSGSVVPLFKDQIDHGGPVTVTHPDVTRFFMSIPEAAQLVLQASALHLKDYSSRSSQAAVYILNMGEPIKIVDLAKKMIELYGNTIKDESNPEGDIAIKFTGLRPGEKLFEELLLGVDPLPTTHDRIYKSSEPSLTWSDMKEHLNEILDIVSDDDVSKLRVLFQEIVNGYVPNGKNVDFISVERDLK